MKEQYNLCHYPIKKNTEKQLERQSRVVRKLLSTKALKESKRREKLTLSDLRKMVTKKRVTPAYFDIEEFLYSF